MLLHKFLLTYSIDKGQHSPAEHQQGGSAAHVGGSAAPSTSATAPSTPTPPLQGLNLEPIFEQEEAEGPEEEQGGVDHPRLRQLYNGITPLTTSLGAFERG